MTPMVERCSAVSITVQPEYAPTRMAPLSVLILAGIVGVVDAGAILVQIDDQRHISRGQHAFQPVGHDVIIAEPHHLDELREWRARNVVLEDH